jgi:hypothetical protein
MLSAAPPLAANMHSTITSWISIVRVQSSSSSWTAAGITTVTVKPAIERGRNSWLATESLCYDSGITRFAESSTASCEQSGSHSRSDGRAIPHLHPLPFAKGEARSKRRSIRKFMRGVNVLLGLGRARAATRCFDCTYAMRGTILPRRACGERTEVRGVLDPTR